MWDSEFESGGDPSQACGVLFHIVEFRDFRGGMTEEVGDLPEGEDRSVLLLHAVDQVGGEGVAEGVDPHLRLLKS